MVVLWRLAGDSNGMVSIEMQFMLSIDRAITYKPVQYFGKSSAYDPRNVKFKACMPGAVTSCKNFQSDRASSGV